MAWRRKPSTSRCSTTWHRLPSRPVWKRSKALYSELHPNVTFTNVYYNQGTDYFPQLSTALSSGDQPNIIMGNPGLYPDLVSEGFVMDLTDNETIKAMNLPSGDLGDVSANGKIYGFPIDFKSWGIFYNKTIFEEQGLEVPTTLTELNAVQDALIAAGIDPYVRSYADAVYGDIECRNTVWTRALDAGDNDVFEKLMSGEKKFADYPYFAEALENWKMRMSKPRTDDMSNTQDMGLERPRSRRRRRCALTEPGPTARRLPRTPILKSASS